MLKLTKNFGIQVNSLGVNPSLSNYLLTASYLGLPDLANTSTGHLYGLAAHPSM